MSGQGLSEEQRRKIEENKQRAIAKRIEKTSPVKRQDNVAQSSIHINASPVRPGNASTFNKGFAQNQPRAVAQGGGQFSNLDTKSVKTPQSQLKNNTKYTELHRQIPESSHNKFQNKGNGPRPSGTTGASSKSYSNTKAFANTSTSANQNPVVSKAKFFGSSGTKLIGKCVLANCERFSVEVGYSAVLIEYFKQLKTKSYDQATKTWSFKWEEYDSFIKGVSRFKPDIEIEGLPRWIIQTFSQQQMQADVVPDADLSHVDEKLVHTLLPFQRQGVNLAIHRNGRLLIADDMGLGKTLQAICIARYYRKEWPVLIVCPSSVRFDWAQQICKWLPSVVACEVNVVEKGSDCSTSGLVNIISYDLLSKKATELKNTMFKVIIMDESHFLKNSKTVRTRAAVPLLKNAKRVLLLSGTPALSRPNELFCQVTAICPGLFKFHEFGVRYCNAKQNQWGWDYSGSSNMGELQLLLEKKVMIRRQKKDVLSQLPAKTRQMVVLDPRSIEKHKDLTTASKLMSVKRKGLDRRGALLQYFQETCKAKLSAVRDYIIDLVEAEKKFLVFAHHREMLDCIETCIQKQASDIQYIRIDGRTNSEQRNFFCSKFQTSDDYRVAILSITAANAGLNLSAANTVVFAELFWNPGILVQAEDRAHRIGQQDSVSVRYLVAQGTADDYIWPLVQGKLNILSKAGLTKDDFSNADTKRMTDTQQSILDMFCSDFIDNSVPENTEMKAEGETCSGQGMLEVKKLSQEAKSETPRKHGPGAGKRSTPQKHKLSSTPDSDKEKSPNKRQVSIMNFVEVSPRKKPRQEEKIEEEEYDSDETLPPSSVEPSPSSVVTSQSHNTEGNTSPRISQEDLVAIECVDWDEEMDF